MPPHPEANFEIQKNQNEPRFDLMVFIVEIISLK